MLRYILLFSILLLNSSVFSQKTVITNINLVDTENLTLLKNKTVWLNGEQIESIDDQAPKEVAPDVTEINGEGKYLSPGLVDAHIHLFQSGGLYTRPDVIDLRKIKSHEEEQAWLRENSEDLLRRYLSCGITTTIDVGGPLVNYSIRDKQNKNLNSASVYLTGPLISTYQPEAFKIEDPPIVKVTSPEEAVALVQKQLPYQPDFIKIWYIVLPGSSAKANYDIVKASIDESHQHGLRVMVHATQLTTARLAVEAGADVLVHSVDDHEIDQEFIDLLKKQKTVYCPTLIVHKKYNEVFAQSPQLTPEDFSIANPFVVGSLFDLKHMTGAEEKLATQYKAYSEKQKEQSAKRINTMNSNLKKLWEAGVIIATSTDAGNIGTHHASSFYEEIAAMQTAGLSPAAILQASTLNGAKVLNKTKEFGQIKPGLLANLLVLKNNPLTSIQHLNKPELVIHRGHLIQPDTLLSGSPAELAQQQLNAYNARDIEAFLAPYSDSVAIYNFPNQLMSKGKEAMRPGYTNMFASLPMLHCKLVNRIVEGNTVIDQELVTINEEKTIKAIAIYKIKAGKIEEVYFIQ